MGGHRLLALADQLNAGDNFQMYTLASYGHMIADEVRTRSHYEALKRTIKPGDVVVDLGAGTGIFSMLACRLGAKRVYAIEPNEWIELARPLAIKNGVDDRIVVIRDFSNNVDLPEQADVVMGDLRGSFPLTNVNVSGLRDAQQRLLKPGGILIPQHDRVFVTPVSAANFYTDRLLDPWQRNDYDLDLSGALPYLANSVVNTSFFDGNARLFSSQLWLELDYLSGALPQTEAHLAWIAGNFARVHFILIWFDTQLYDNVGFTTAPWREDRATIYGYSLLPLERPLDVTPGDQLTLDLRADLVQNEYLFTWDTTLRTSAGGAIKAALQQSSAKGRLLPPAPSSTLVAS